MWHGERIYFLSDRGGTMNVWSVDPETRATEQHTSHDYYDARWPTATARATYMLGADIRVLDLATGQDREVAIELPSDRIRHRPRVEDASKTLESYGLDHEGERVVLSARGELWVRPVGEGRVVQLTRSPGVRERSPAISPEGDLVVCITDETGEQQIALFDSKGKAERQIREQERFGLDEPARLVTGGARTSSTPTSTTRCS